jgi:hypothetical protein
LKEDPIDVPGTWESEVTNSKTPPFSDKLMISHAALALSTAIFYYGAALSTTMRKDLVGHYMGIIAKDLIVAEDAQNIMVDNGWLEQPPQFLKFSQQSFKKSRRDQFPAAVISYRS